MSTIVRELIKRRQGVGFLAVLLAGIASAAGSFTVGTLAAQESERQRRSVEIEAIATSQAQTLDLRLTTYKAALLTLAKSEAAATQPDWAALRKEAVKLADLFGCWIASAAAGGTFSFVFNTDVTDGGPLPPPTAPRSTLPELVAAEKISLETMNPTVSDAFVERIAKRLVITIATPLEWRTAPSHFLYMSFDSEHLSGLLASTKLPEGYFSSLADGSRRVIARSSQFYDVRLSPLPEWLVRDTADLSAGIFVGPPIRGPADRIYAVQRLSAAPNWMLVVSAPVPSWSGVMRPALWSMAVFLCITAALLALLRYNLISEPKLSAEREAGDKSALVEQLHGEDYRKSLLIGVLGHKLRAPLIAQLGVLDLIIARRTDAIDAPLLERIRLDGHKLLTLLDDLLEIARLGTGEVKLRSTAFQPRLVAEDALTMLEPFAGRNRNTIDLQAEVPDYMLSGDPIAIRRILINFGTNAAKFSTGGRIKLSVRELDVSDEFATVEFAVCDTGIGIQAGDLPKLFQEFGIAPSSHGEGANGTGLGLAICKKLADAMDGIVGASSLPGSGSRFWLTVRLPKITVTSPVPVKEGNKLDGLTILLAEDQELVQILTVKLLEDLGGTVTAVNNGLEAVERATSEKFNIILMDLRMPCMDGAEAARTIREQNGPNCKTPIIGLTAHQNESGAIELSGGALTACLRKPLDVDAMLEAAAPERSEPKERGEHER